MIVSGPKDEKVLEVCEELQNSGTGFNLLKLFMFLKEHGHFEAMKTLNHELYEKSNNNLKDVISVDELKIPKIPYKELEECCNG